ncbi:MAG: translocation/assembly module TamB domain-containing protein, partial [Saprospiraceae bacterium]|nr:translocation/assembly module TamB domain-containing protein [Saprospiraceae bacterium]
LQGSLKNYAQSKLRILKQDQNELNRQVFGLIVAGQFLNPTNNVNGADVTINTVTELLSNQLSLYFSDLLSNLVTDVKFLSGIDLNIGYTSYQNVDLATAGDESFGVSGQELQLYFQPYFFNDRLSVSVGTIFNLDENSPLGTSVNQGSLTSGDFTIEYALTADRRLKIKAYASQETVIGNGTRTRYGAGLSYRNEFDNFKELIDGIKQGFKKAQN